MILLLTISLVIAVFIILYLIWQRKQSDSFFARDSNAELSDNEQALAAQILAIAHKFNNHLTTILMNLSTIAVDLDKKDEKYELLKEAETACLQARELTEQLRLFFEKDNPDKRANETSQAMGKDTMQEKSGRILIMDDDLGVLTSLQKILNYLGYEVEKAAEGKEALQRFRNAHHSSTPFDLVILDLHVEKGAGGNETQAALQEIDPTVKTILTTGFDTQSMSHETQELGFSAYLQKPFRLEDVSRTIQKVLS